MATPCHSIPAPVAEKGPDPARQDTNTEQCTDPTYELSIKIPCRLAERVEVYARETGSTMESVLIEALDIFLRENANR